MKKFIFLLILLIITSGAVLYFGWVQVPENSQAVVFSKITGYEDSSIESGSFHWRWQKLIPKTFKVHIFDISSHSASVISEGKMPSGNVYSSIIAGRPDFSYRIAFTVTYSIKKSNLPEYFRLNIISPEDPVKWYSDKDRIIESEGKKFITSLASASSSLSASASVEKKLEEYLNTTFDDINITELTVTDYNIPDLELYAEAKRQYLNIIKNKENLILESESKAVKENKELERQLELLEKYGELLTKYPILLEYLKTNPEMDILKVKIGKKLEQ